ncbi:MAG: hypothetical protein Kow0063_25780 [Anaerolineae bacterium]
MNSFISSSTRRLGRILIAMILGIVALVGLAGVWGGQPAAAIGPAAANTHDYGLLLSGSNVLTYYIFLPVVFKSQDLVFYDDFSNTSSGWPHRQSFEDCYYEYKNGRYRVEVDEYGQRCIIPNLQIPKQVNGTFKVKVRRTSDEERPMLYGLIFGAGVDATEDRWALEVYPNKDSDCNNKPFYWLYALVDGKSKYFRDRCTDSIDTDENDWNELKIIRNGATIKVYINGESKGEYNDANYLLDQGYTLLQVVSVSNDEIVVEFDDFEIRRSTTP